MAIDGILLVDKPSGLTSHDVVDRIRRRFKIEKVGHAGTLDPQATGLLLIMVGRGTRLSNMLITGDKTYEGIFRLGIATDTQDADGRPVREGDFSHVTREMLTAEMRKLTGDIMQIPPMVSAVKIGGVPLYQLARKGQTVERQPKLIHVYEFSLHDFTPPRAAFSIRCTKGTYVRTLCADIGDTLNCGAHLESLRRTVCGGYHVANAIGLEKILALQRDQLAELLIPLHRIDMHTGNPL